MPLRLYKNRYFRTVFLALFATVCFVASAIFIFDVETRVMLDFFIASVVGLGVIVVAALLFTALVIILRRLFQR